MERSWAGHALVWLGRRIVPAIGIAVLAVVLVLQVVWYGFDPRSWEWLFLSGVAVLALCLIAYHGQSSRVDAVIVRLVKRGVVVPARDPETEAHAIAGAVRAKITSWIPAAGALSAVALALLMAAVWRLALGAWPVSSVGFWFELAAAALAGFAVGHMIAFGLLGAALTRSGYAVRPQPGHVDGAAGLLPVGALYLRQAGIVAALALYAGFWWLMFPVYHDGAFLYWRESYLLVMVVGIVAEVLVCVVPLWSFHRIMLRQQIVNRHSADAKAVRIAALKSDRARSRDAAEQQRIDVEIGALSAEWSDLESMPVWPLDTKVRRRFTVNNAVVLVPLALKTLTSEIKWEDILNAVSNTA